MVGEYGGDHLDFGGAEFKGPFVAKGNIYQQAAAPTALDALPARVAGFTGRERELGQLLAAFDPLVVGAPEAVLVAAVSGLGGIGKTALAVEAAHAACETGWFPGGVLFVNLHGYDDDIVTAEQALEDLLRALGAAPEHVPNGVDARAALYRSVLAERGRERGAVLILADNVSSPEQVRHLLPGDARHRLLVTSRNKLPQLGARLLSLDELTPGEAYDLFDRALRIADPDDERVEREREAALELASCCGHLPLAIQIAAALLVLESDKSVAELAAELAEFGDRLVHLDDGERSVRAAFDLSYRRLPPEQARLLRLLALAPGPEVTDEVVPVLAGVDALPVGVLSVLSRSHLVERGSGRGRWQLHDLVRAFGGGVVTGEAGLREVGEAARERVLEFYCRWAYEADDRLRWLPGAEEPERFGNRAEALAWFDRERAGLVAAAQWAREERYADTAVRLSQYVAEYLYWRRSFDDLITVCGVAGEAAHRADNQVGEGIASNSLGDALREVGRVEEAIDAQVCARHLFQVSGDRHNEANAWNNLGVALREVGRVEEAIDAHTGARELYRGVGDRQGEAMVWNNLGLALRLAGRTGEAFAAYRRALVIYREFKDEYRAGTALHNLAVAHEADDHPAEARTYYIQAADAFTRADAPVEAAEARACADSLTP
jgi:tetratricopeptide (TPR) repeat protein